MSSHPKNKLKVKRAVVLLFQVLSKKKLSNEESGELASIIEGFDKDVKQAEKDLVTLKSNQEKKGI